MVKCVCDVDGQLMSKSNSAYEERSAAASAECRQVSWLDDSARTHCVGDRQPRVAQRVRRLGRRSRVRAVRALGA